MNVQGLVGGKN